MSDVKTLTVDLVVGLKGLKSGLSMAVSLVKGAASKIKSGFETVTGIDISLSGLIRKVRLTVLALLALGAAVTVLSVRDFAVLERKVAEVGSLMEKTADQLTPLTNQLQRMAVQFGASTADLAGATYDIVSASFALDKSASQSSAAMRVLRASVIAAKAGLVDVKIAADSITTVLNSFGMSGRMASRVADVLFMVVKKGKTTFAELAPVMGQVSSLAHAAGASLYDLGAMLASLTRAGVRTEEAITGVRAILTSIVSPGKQSVEAFAALKRAHKGMTAELNSGSVHRLGLVKWLKQVIGATGGSMDKLAEIFPNIRALANASVFGGKGLKGLVADLKAMRRSAGSAAKAAAIMSDTIFGQWKKMWASLAVLREKLGQALAPAVKAALVAVNKILAKVFPDFERLMGKLGKGVKAFVPTVQKAGKWVEQWYAKNGKAIWAWADAVPAALVKGARVVWDWLKSLWRWLEDAFRRLRDFFNFIRDLFATGRFRAWIETEVKALLAKVAPWLALVTGLWVAWQGLIHGGFAGFLLGIGVALAAAIVLWKDQIGAWLKDMAFTIGAWLGLSGEDVEYWIARVTKAFGFLWDLVTLNGDAWAALRDSILGALGLTQADLDRWFAAVRAGLLFVLDLLRGNARAWDDLAAIIARVLGVTTEDVKRWAAEMGKGLAFVRDLIVDNKKAWAELHDTIAALFRLRPTELDAAIERIKNNLIVARNAAVDLLRSFGIASKAEAKGQDAIQPFMPNAATRFILPEAFLLRAARADARRYADALIKAAAALQPAEAKNFIQAGMDKLKPALDSADNVVRTFAQNAHVLLSRAFDLTVRQSPSVLDVLFSGLDMARRMIETWAVDVEATIHGALSRAFGMEGVSLALPGVAAGVAGGGAVTVNIPVTVQGVLNEAFLYDQLIPALERAAQMGLFTPRQR